MTSRRGFLRRAAAAAGAGLLAQLPGRRLWAAALDEIGPEVDDALLRELALRAMDAAREAGAGFADVRLTVTQDVMLIGRYQHSEIWSARPAMDPPRLRFTVRFGVRALVDGAWGIAAGSELTPDAVTQAARTAVAVARSNRPRRPRTLELAPAPRVADGRWATPIEQDPFAVPLREQSELALAAVSEAAKVPETSWTQTVFFWLRATRVFASTEGSLCTQRVALARPSATVGVTVGGRGGFAQVPGLRSGGFGYEALGAPTLVAEMGEAVERALALARAASQPAQAEVGRFDLVLGPEAVASVLATTIAPAVNLERALGFRANQEGTSFAAPPSAILGEYRIGSKLLTVRGDRSRPHGWATAAWDDEGVAPEDYTFVRDGVIVDYHTSRETAPHLGGWYRARGEAVRSHGCTQSTPELRPVVQAPNLTIEPSPETTTVDDLIAGTKRGYYIDSTVGDSDQQVLSGQFTAGPMSVRQIVGGKLGGYVKNLAFQLITPRFWAGLDGLGGPASSEPVVVGTNDPSLPMGTVQAVPARFRQVNILNVGRTA